MLSDRTDDVSVKPSPRPKSPRPLLAESSTRESQAQLARDVLRSRTFAKSTRLCEMFAFISGMALDGRAAELNEQKIGMEVFGRSPAYNPSDDSIVRAQARLLRQKLEEYFEHECPHTADVIVIPKGGYVPVFRPRSQPAPEAPAGSPAPTPSLTAAREPAHEPPAEITPAAPAAAIAKPEPPARPVARSAYTRWSRALAIPLILLATVLGWLLWRTLLSHDTTPADTLWSDIFRPSEPTLIVPSDDGLVLFQELTHTSVSLGDYLDGTYLRRSTPSSRQDLTFDPQWFAAHQYTSSADLNLTLRLSRLPAAAHAEVEAINARELRLETLKTRNVILIGGPGSNPWVDLFADRLNFQLGWNWTSGEGFVRNQQPQANEAPVYRDVLLGSTRRSYGLLAFLPGIDGNRRALLFEGTGMAGTEAAADFPFEPAFQTFLHTIGATPRSVPYFEVLLETVSIGGNAPESRVVAYRLHA